MKLQTLSIPARDTTLAGLYYVPDRGMRPVTVIYAHGFTSGKYSMDHLAGYLAGRGYPGISFDAIGHKLGASGGEMQRVEQAAENLQDVLSWVRVQEAPERIVLVGHSMGGAATISVAAQEARTKPGSVGKLAGFVPMCVAQDPIRAFSGALGRAMLEQRQDYVAGAPALQLLAEIKDLVRGGIHGTEIPALFIAARQDVLVSVEDIEGLAAQFGRLASVHVIDTTHLEAPDRSRGAILQWLDRL